MSYPVYAKLWHATAKYQQRRTYGWYQITRRSLIAMAVPTVFCTWLMFPILPENYRKVLSLGLHKPIQEKATYK
eukprot:GDKH01018928.1.p1 GENE.GDKH01018928.1~~GDKH01018928.1.p1  ORF type:complete len:74 (+),score=10.89 GDKH01018928.1:224-445(+)